MLAHLKSWVAGVFGLGKSAEIFDWVYIRVPSSRSGIWGILDIISFLEVVSMESLTEIPSDVGYTRYFVFPELLGLSKMLGMPNIWGNTRHFG